VEHAAVADIVAMIRMKIVELKTAITNNNTAMVVQICTEIELLVKDRADKLLILK